MRELVTMPDAEIMRELTVWTTHLMLAVFIVAFVLLGKIIIVAAAGAELPICRLRYNSNIEQSMKGDDVLAFVLTRTL